MQDLLRDEDDDVYVRMRKRMLRGAGPAVRKLRRVARGQDGFRDDHERAACIALARIGCALTNADDGTRKPVSLGYHPSHTPERAAELLARLMHTDRPGDADDISDDQPEEEAL